VLGVQNETEDYLRTEDTGAAAGFFLEKRNVELPGLRQHSNPQVEAPRHFGEICLRADFPQAIQV